MKSGTVMGVVDESIVRRYIQYLRLERSYSKNTLDAYRRDLQKLLVYYADNNIDFRYLRLYLFMVTLSQASRSHKQLTFSCFLVGRHF